MKDRIKAIRKDKKMSRQAFADTIGISISTLDSYEYGRRVPLTPIINTICDKFSVNKSWLVDGVGDMYLPLTKADQITDFAADVIKEDGFRARFVAMLSEMSPEEWAMMERMAHRLLDEKEG